MSEQRSEKDIIDEAYSDEAAKTWRAPVQGYPAGIPWPVHLEAYAAYCKRWSKQTAMIDLKGRYCRGGFGTAELDELLPGWLDRVSYVGRLASRIAELEGAVECTVQTMQTSAGADYYVHLRMGDRFITPHSFKIWGHAAYEVEEWKWFFGQGDKPDLMTFNTDAPTPPSPTPAPRVWGIDAPVIGE